MLKKDAIGIPGPSQRHRVGYGVEVEAEFREPPMMAPEGWVGKADHSLRGMFSIEYVSTKVLNRIPMEARLDELWEHMKKYDMVDTVRAATHIHVNMKGTNALYLANVLTLYYLVEDTVIKYGCGAGRFGNFFCLPGSQCGLTPGRVAGLFSWNYNTVNLRSLQEDFDKYAALNLNALRKFGSLEFRALRTPTDNPDSIKEILALFSKILVLARKYEHPSLIVSELSAQGAEKFVEFLLPKRIKEKMEDPVDFEDIREGLLLSQHIAYNSVEF